MKAGTDNTRLLYFTRNIDLLNQCLVTLYAPYKNSDQERYIRTLQCFPLSGKDEVDITLIIQSFMLHRSPSVCRLLIEKSNMC